MFRSLRCFHGIVVFVVFVLIYVIKTNLRINLRWSEIQRDRDLYDNLIKKKMMAVTSKAPTADNGEHNDKIIRKSRRDHEIPTGNIGPGTVTNNKSSKVSTEKDRTGYKTTQPVKFNRKVSTKKDHTGYKTTQPVKFNPKVSTKKDHTRYKTTQPVKFIQDARTGHYMKIVGAWGRLGNHIFFYAGLRGIGTIINYTPMIPADDPIFKLFNINKNYSVPTSPLTNVEKRGTRGIGIYTPELMQPPKKHVNLTIAGYLQTWKYFQHIDAEIREELTLKDEIKKKVTKIFQDLKITSRLKIGVHARRGDFVNRAGTAIPNKEYFYKAMDMMRQLYKNPVFVVCSEDIKWVKSNLAGQGVYFVHENVEVDFGALVSCDHSIISSGTFGWWVAYLTNGTTIYYKDFPEMPLLSTFKLEDYYPPGWIGL